MLRSLFDKKVKLEKEKVKKVKLEEEKVKKVKVKVNKVKLRGKKTRNLLEVENVELTQEQILYNEKEKEKRTNESNVGELHQHNIDVTNMTPENVEKRQEYYRKRVGSKYVRPFHVANPKYNNKHQKSIQAGINSKNGKIDYDKLKEQIDNTLHRYNHYIMRPDMYEMLISKLKKGDRVSYISEDDTYRSGGYVNGVYAVTEGEGYNFYMEPFGKDKMKPFCVKFVDLRELWHQPKSEMGKRKANPDKLVTSKKIVLYKRPTKVTRWPITLKDKEGNDIIVLYAQDESKRVRFKSTTKFKQAQVNGWEFCD